MRKVGQAGSQGESRYRQRERASEGADAAKSGELEEMLVLCGFEWNREGAWEADGVQRGGCRIVQRLAAWATLGHQSLFQQHQNALLCPVEIPLAGVHRMSRRAQKGCRETAS